MCRKLRNWSSQVADLKLRTSEKNCDCGIAELRLRSNISSKVAELRLRKCFLQVAELRLRTPKKVARAHLWPKLVHEKRLNGAKYTEIRDTPVCLPPVGLDLPVYSLPGSQDSPVQPILKSMKLSLKGPLLYNSTVGYFNYLSICDSRLKKFAFPRDSNWFSGVFITGWKITNTNNSVNVNKNRNFS